MEHFAITKTLINLNRQIIGYFLLAFCFGFANFSSAQSNKELTKATKGQEMNVRFRFFSDVATGGNGWQFKFSFLL